MSASYNPGLCSAEPGGPWCRTFALGQLENLNFFIQIICWVPPRFYRFRALGSLQFSLEHSLPTDHSSVLQSIYFSGFWTLEHNNDNTCFPGSLLFLSSGLRQVTVKRPRLGIIWLTMTTHLLQSSSSFTAPFSNNSGDERECE